MIERGKPVETQANKIPIPNKKETSIERRNPCGDSEIPERLQENWENLVDDEFQYMEALTPVLLMRPLQTHIQET